MLVVLSMLCIVSCSSRTLDVRELVTIEVTGANGYGVLSLKSDRARIAEIVREEGESLRETDEKRLQRLFVREAAMNSLIFSADRTTGLKNGDAVVIHASHDEELAKSGAVRFKNLKFTYIVEGLDEAKPIDIESEMELLFTGFESRGTAQISLSGDMERYREYFDITFLTPKSNLSNGATIDVRVKPDNDALTVRGRIAEEKVLTFTVGGLQELETVDVFKNLVLVYDGISDTGYVSIDTTRLPYDWVEAGGRSDPPLSFTVTPTSHLTNGDKVTVTALVDRDRFADFGLSVAELSKEYTVSGLKEFPRNLDHVDLTPLFNKLQTPLGEDIQLRLAQNTWNEDARVGIPLSQWDIQDRRGVVRVYYGYPQSNRADNFVALIYKIEIEGTCIEATPYASHYEEGDTLSSTLYLVYVVDAIMYDTVRVDDFKGVSLKFHSDMELSAVSAFKERYGGAGVVIVEAAVPEHVRFSDS